MPEVDHKTLTVYSTNPWLIGHGGHVYHYGFSSYGPVTSSYVLYDGLVPDRIIATFPDMAALQAWRKGNQINVRARDKR